MTFSTVTPRCVWLLAALLLAAVVANATGVYMDDSLSVSTAETNQTLSTTDSPTADVSSGAAETPVYVSAVKVRTTFESAPELMEAISEAAEISVRSMAIVDASNQPTSGEFSEVSGEMFVARVGFTDTASWSAAVAVLEAEFVDGVWLLSSTGSDNDSENGNGNGDSNGSGIIHGGSREVRHRLFCFLVVVALLLCVGAAVLALTHRRKPRREEEEYFGVFRDDFEEYPPMEMSTLKANGRYW